MPDHAVALNEFSIPRRVAILYGVPDPDVTTSDIELTNEFDRAESVQALVNVLRSLSDEVEITTVRVDLKRVSDAVQQIHHFMGDLAPRDRLVFNLCDGTELDGYPGFSIIKQLELNNLMYTGSASEFYRITTPKTLLKQYLQRQCVPTSEFVQVHLDSLEADVQRAVDLLGFPLIVKPSISYASLGITSKSVTHTVPETCAQIRTVLETNPLAGCFCERYLPGREFTVFVCGTAGASDDAFDDVHVYPAAERCFNPKLKQNERFLAFDTYWAGWSLTSRPENVSEEDQYYKYQLAPAEWQSRLQHVAREAYRACRGSGYGRVDMRTTSMEECDVYVLEVNANCGLTFDESSSLGEILRLSKVTPTTLIRELVDQSARRWANTMQQTLQPAKSLSPSIKSLVKIPTAAEEPNMTTASSSSISSLPTPPTPF